MDINELYNTASGYADQLKDILINGASEKICVMKSDKGDIICGISSLCIINGDMKKVSAEMSALNNMYAVGGTHAVEMITIDLYSKEIIVPTGHRLKKMSEENINNMTCMVVISAEEAVQATELMPKMDFFEGFGDPAPSDELDQTNDAVPQIQISADNPFWADSSTAPDKEVVTLASSSKPKDESVESQDISPAPVQQISKEELLREAKQRKKVAKTLFSFKKKY